MTSPKDLPNDATLMRGLVLGDHKVVGGKIVITSNAFTHRFPNLSFYWMDLIAPEEAVKKPAKRTGLAAITAGSARSVKGVIDVKHSPSKNDDSHCTANCVEDGDGKQQPTPLQIQKVLARKASFLIGKE